MSLYEKVQELYLSTERQTFRKMAVKLGYSQSTVHVAVAHPHKTRWTTLRDVVEYLGGNPAEFLPLWEDEHNYEEAATTRIFNITLDESLINQLAQGKAVEVIKNRTTIIING